MHQYLNKRPLLKAGSWGELLGVVRLKFDKRKTVYCLCHLNLHYTHNPMKVHLLHLTLTQGSSCFPKFSSLIILLDQEHSHYSQTLKGSWIVALLS